MKGLTKRIAAMEGGRNRLVVATVNEGGTVDAVANANGFTILPSDLVVVLKKPAGCDAGTIRVCGGDQ